MKKIASLLAFILFLLITSNLSFGFYGSITSDTTWADSLFVDGDVVVERDATLRVAPGTRVIFNSDTSLWDYSIGERGKCDLIIRGSLRAIGDSLAPSDNIQFISSDTIPGRWGGIWLEGSFADTISFAQIRYPTVGIHCYSVFPVISHNWISDCRGDDATTTPEDYNGHIGAGVWCRESSPVITFNGIARCVGGAGYGPWYGSGGEGIGIYVAQSPCAYIVGNNISLCKGGRGEGGTFEAGNGADGVGIRCDSVLSIEVRGNEILQCKGGRGGYPGDCGESVGGRGKGISLFHVSLANLSHNSISSCCGGMGYGWVYGGVSGDGIGIFLKEVEKCNISDNSISGCHGADGYPGGIAGDGIALYCLDSSPTLKGNILMESQGGIADTSWPGWRFGMGIGISIKGRFSPFIGGLPDFQNDIYGSSDYNLANYTSKQISATYNWWGRRDAALIDSSIFDCGDDSLYGCVLYSPWAETSLTEVKPREKGKTLPKAHLLLENFPNPFNSSTIISFRLPQRAWVSLKIYNILGQEVKELVEGFQSEGVHKTGWDGTDDRGKRVRSGIYFCLLQSHKLRLARRMVLIR